MEVPASHQPGPESPEARIKIYFLPNLLTAGNLFCGFVALTNLADSPLAQAAGTVVEMLAGPEHSGVACRTFQHTLALLLHLEALVPGLKRTQ